MTPARGGQPLAAPEQVQYPDGTANFMYLIGSQADGTLGWAAVRVGNLQTAPAGIQTGDGSTEEAAQGGLPIGVLVVIPVALGMLAVWSRTRRQRPMP